MLTAAVIVPSARRPGNARELAREFGRTADTLFTELVLAVDGDDPHLGEYEALAGEHLWITLEVIRDSPHRIGPIVNQVARGLLGSAAPPELIGFMGDDHRPRTEGWPEILGGELAGRPGVAYGNDLHQRENLPTACLVSTPLADALGYLVPHGLYHLFFDDFWKRLGQATHLAYRDDVIIEHCHPDAGKSEHDAVYAAGGRNPAVWEHDRAVWDAYLRDGSWAAALGRISHLRAVTR